MGERYENRLNAAVQSLIFDSGNPEELARFYAKLLGGVLESDPYGGYLLKVPGLGLELGFQEDEDYTPPVWPGTKGDQLQMLHLDIRVSDRKQAADVALSLGATLPAEQFCQPDWPVQWITLLDPAGHPFCLWDG